MELLFRAVAEDDPGPVWQAACQRAWTGCERWFLAQGDAARPSYHACRRAMAQHLPRLLPLWHGLVDLAGGGDRAARLLSLWCPSPYLVGCSQAVAVPGEPVLLRNYDYHPGLCEATFLRSRWSGGAVLASLDCLWGALDGVNEPGLALCLSFAGRRAVGAGFGIPLLLRAALELCDDVPAAVGLLADLPCHMSYHVLMADAAGRHGTLTLAPDRPARWRALPAVTNHDEPIEWPEHAALTHSVSRLSRLRHWLAAPGAAGGELLERFLQPPLYQTGWRRGHGTLYTACYRPRSGALELAWPGQRWRLSLGGFTPGERHVGYVEPAGAK